MILGEAKIAGSAQRRRRNALLQHGSVLLEKSSHAPELPGIGNLAEHLPNANTLIDAWVGNIATRLGDNVNLVRGEVSNQERQAAENHVGKRYGTEGWQKRR